jgi:hypothetical protein
MQISDRGGRGRYRIGGALLKAEVGNIVSFWSQDERQAKYGVVAWPENNRSR